MGRHYSHTLHAWYDLWMKNRNKAELSAYSGRLSRLWEIFLAWSTVAAGIGSATCYQIVAHKNTYEFPRDIFCSKDTAEARRGDTARRDAAWASGAQLVSTDYYLPGGYPDTGYRVTVPGGGVARCNPVRIPQPCRLPRQPAQD